MVALQFPQSRTGDIPYLLILDRELTQIEVAVRGDNHHSRIGLQCSDFIDFVLEVSWRVDEQKTRARESLLLPFQFALSQAFITLEIVSNTNGEHCLIEVLNDVVLQIYTDGKQAGSVELTTQTNVGSKARSVVGVILVSELPE